MEESKAYGLQRLSRKYLVKIETKKALSPYNNKDTNIIIKVLNCQSTFLYNKRKEITHY